MNKPVIKAKLAKGLHPKNRHRDGYNFDRLLQRCPELEDYVVITPRGEKSVNFSDPASVKQLNRALLLTDYDLKYWDMPDNYLCPPIPGRADYLLYMADLLSQTNKGKVPKGAEVKVLDLGVGSNCIYPLLGQQLFNWSFIGSDIDPIALDSAVTICKENNLADAIELRYQKQAAHVLKGIIRPGDKISFTLCNPPFHSSAEAAAQGSQRKVQNLNKNKSQAQPNSLNFAGKSNELWCKGGELAFINKIIHESKEFAGQCQWFSSLVSDKDNLRPLKQAIAKVGATHRVIEMKQGQKITRILAWHF